MQTDLITKVYLNEHLTHSFGGGGRKISEFFFPTKFFFQKCSWGGDFGVFGAPHAPTRGSRGVGKQYTSSYDHDM